MAHDGHSHTIAPDAALAGAEARVVELGERFTEPRRRVFRLMVEAGRPLKAYDLIAGLARGGTPANPPTVYRALAFLTRTGLVHRVESDASYVVCSHGPHGAGDIPLMLVCDRCGAVAEQHLGQIDARARTAAASAGFQIGRLVLEARGLCRTCAAAEAA